MKKIRNSRIIFLFNFIADSSKFENFKLVRGLLTYLCISLDILVVYKIKPFLLVDLRIFAPKTVTK